MHELRPASEKAKDELQAALNKKRDNLCSKYTAITEHIQKEVHIGK